MPSLHPRTMFGAFALLVLTWLSTSAIAGDGEILFVNGFEGSGNVPQFMSVDDQAIAAETLLEIDIDTSEPVNQAGLTWSLEQGPVGMTVNALSGLLRWTPTRDQVATHPITVGVEDLAGLVNTLDFNVTVIDISAAPLIDPIEDRTVQVGVEVEIQVVAVDPDPGDAVEFGLDTGSPGMTVDPFTGLLEWLPTIGDLGSVAVTVRATDPGGRYDIETFSLTVVDGNTAPVLDPINDRGATPHVEFEIQATASDPDPADPLHWSLPERPAGMSIDPDTGLLRWTPASLQLGPHAVTVAVADSRGGYDQTGFEVFVDLNRPPIAIDDDGFRVERGDTLVVPAPGVLANDIDPNDDPLTAQLVNGPERGSLSLNADGGFDYTPDNPVGTIGFDEKWNFTAGSGANLWPPIIANLDDDPQSEVLVHRMSQGASTIRALDGVSGEVDWEIVFGAGEMAGNTRPAVADIDGDGLPEILLIGGEQNNSIASQLQLIALTRDGQVEWLSEELPEWFYMDGERRGSRSLRASAITVADLDQDGIPEIIAAPDKGPAGFHVWDHEGRTLASVHEPDTSIGNSILDAARTRITLVDLDLDGDLEIVVGDTAWHHDGTLIWKLGLESAAESAFPIVVNLDDDPYPELVRTRGQGASSPNSPTDLLAINHDGTILWEVPRSGHFHTTTFDTAPITAADVNGDGYADILRTYPIGSDLFEVLDGRDGSILWSKNVPTRGSGATAIDLDGDGFLEVVLFGGDAKLYVWDGRDGTEKGVFDATEFPNVPGPNTVPVFADIDADGRAELVLSQANSSAVVPAIIAVESPNDDWPPMRSIWNQVPYHVTNVNDNLSVPAVQRQHWLLPGLNQYMINERLPEARIEDADFFTYRASDGEFLSNEARVDIMILPPNSPPRILSTPKTLASPGFEYVYNVLAVDADVGELLVWSLAEAPAAMSIEALGRITWTPTAADLGSHAVVVEVTDTVGARAYQNFIVDVVPATAVPDLAGLTEAQAIAALDAESLIASPLRDVFSDTVPEGVVAGQDPPAGSPAAAGGTVEVEISRGPIPLQVPDLVSLRRTDALAEIAPAGFTSGSMTFVNDVQPADTVLSQDPPPLGLAAPGTPIDLTVSGGPRAVIEIIPTIIPAGTSGEVLVSVRASDGTLLDPQPTVNLSLDIEPGNLVGTSPSLDGATIQTGVDSQGQFGVVASFDAGGGAEQISEIAVIAQPISDGDGADVYSAFGEQILIYQQLLTDLIEAVETNDTAAIGTIDESLGQLLEEVDTRRLRSMTPYVAEGGVPPGAAALTAAGFVRGIDDNAYQGVGLDLVALLETMQAVADEGLAPDAVLNELNQNLAATVAALVDLEPEVFGVIDSAEVIIALLGTRIPNLVVSDIRAVRQALRDADIIAEDGTVQGGARFTLPGVMVANQIRSNIIRKVYVPYLGQVARAMGTIIAAGVLESYSNDGAVIGVISGGSLAIHVFEIPNSVIEGFGFDALLAEGNSVTMVGPELIDAVLDIVNQDLPSANDFKDLNNIMDAVQAEISLAENLANAYNEANTTPSFSLRGCLLDGFPTCRQLVYPGGFASVYKVESGLSLPAPVVFIVRNLAGGGMAVFVANFVPTREEQEN